MTKPSGSASARGEPAAITASHKSRQAACYWRLRREQRCIRCWGPSRPGKAECCECAAKHAKHWKAAQRTCLGPCGRTLRYDPTMTEAIVRHFCKACGKVTGWRRVAV